jgi:hypothetical protein
MVHVLVEAAWVHYFNMMVHCTRSGDCRNCFVNCLDNAYDNESLHFVNLTGS